jgi:hypothetical protein
VNVTAGAELWAKYPWWNCHNWCFKWEKVIKCDRIASITVSIDLAADAHADVNATGPLVAIQAAFDRLRLDYPILDKIPLEGIANAALANQLVYVFDASKLVASVPVLGSKFKVDSVSLPPSRDSIPVGVNIKQI